MSCRRIWRTGQGQGNQTAVPGGFRGLGAGGPEGAENEECRERAGDDCRESRACSDGGQNGESGNMCGELGGMKGESDITTEGCRDGGHSGEPGSDGGRDRLGDEKFPACGDRNGNGGWEGDPSGGHTYSVCTIGGGACQAPRSLMPESDTSGSTSPLVTGTAR